jgi:hypothetical protein
LTETRNERIRSEAYQLSEVLMNDPGDPIDWYNKPFDSIIRLGLSNESFNKTNYLSLTKIASFNSSCSADYDAVKSRLGSPFDFSIFLFERFPTDQKLIECKPSVFTVRAINSTLRRIVYFYYGYGELIIQMW